MHRSARAIVLVSLSCVVVEGWAQSPPVGLTRTDLSRHDLSILGREAIQTHVDFAPGAVASRHRHHGEELIYVPEGTRLTIGPLGEAGIS